MRCRDQAGPRTLRFAGQNQQYRLRVAVVFSQSKLNRRLFRSLQAQPEYGCLSSPCDKRYGTVLKTVKLTVPAMPFLVLETSYLRIS